MDHEKYNPNAAWVAWILGDNPMPVGAVAVMHDLVLGFGQSATSHERLAMIAKFPVYVEVQNIVSWVAETSHIADPRIVALFENMNRDRRIELTGLRIALERYIMDKIDRRSPP